MGLPSRSSMHSDGSATTAQRAESGFALLLVLTTLIPAVLLVGLFSSVLVSRSDELQRERGLERALMAAESGVDYAIFCGRRGMLNDGATYDRQLGPDTSYHVEATHLLHDGLDNDNDGRLDTADDDEDVFQVVVTGRYRGVQRRLAAYLGPVPLFPNVTTALGVANPAVDLRIGGSSHLSGFDAGGAGDVPALSIFTPGTTANLLASLTAAEQARIDGPGGPPSLGTMTPLDLDDLVSIVQNVADLVLTSALYPGLSFGDMASNDPRITYRNGNLKLTGTSHGGGVLVVTGDLEVMGNFSFDGLIIVLGNISNGSGSALIRGAMLQGPSAATVDLRGNFDLQFSSTALDFASATTGLYVAFNGWQELRRQ
ncbi:MAG: hypothetical protein R3F56_06830 [Planctomycetota bacterium]